MTLEAGHAPFELTNLSPRTIGLPVELWIDLRGDIVLSGSKSKLAAGVRSAVLAWAEVNGQKLAAHWEGRLDGVELAASLKRALG